MSDKNNDFSVPMDDISLDDVDFSEDLGELNITDSLEEELGFSVKSLVADDNFKLDFDAEFDDIEDLESDLGDAAEVLKSYADVSSDLVEYYNMALDAMQKLFAVSEAKKPISVRPSISEFSYIVDDKERQLVYGFFCQTLLDFTSDSRYASLSEREAYELMKDEIYKDLRWTPGLYEDRFKQTFHALYENNKKLSQALGTSRVNNITGLLDEETLKNSALVFKINSLPFHILTNFFSDYSLIPNPDMVLDTQYLGDFCDEVRHTSGKRITCQVMYNAIMQFLASPDTMRMMGLDEDSVSDYSTGELFRRFILKELLDGTFCPMSLPNNTVSQYSDELQGLLAQSLYRSIKQHSIAAELLFITLMLMITNSRRYKSIFHPFVVGITQYLSSFAENPSLVNPVFYTLVNQIPSEQQKGGNIFQITFTVNNQVQTEEVDGILCEVVGDNNNVYRVPLVHFNTKEKCVICPPREIVDSLASVSRVSRVSVNGDMRYRYVPSYTWLSNLNITASTSLDSSVIDVSMSSQQNNPLLDILLNYDNEFVTEGEDPQVVCISGHGIRTLMGVNRGNTDSGINICSLVLEDGTEITSGGVFIKDTDDSIVVRYTSPETNVEEVLVLDEDSYEENSYQSSTASSDGSLSYQEATGIDFNQYSLIKDYNYLREIVNRVCDLSAIDYEQELEDCRTIISRDLCRIIDISSLDTMLGYFCIGMFVDYAESNDDKMDSFNFQTLKELADIVIGTQNPLSKFLSYEPEAKDAILNILNKKDQVVQGIIDRIQSLDVHTLALQGVGLGELTGNNRSVYDAMHYIPCIHERLRVLEDSMVLIRVLREIGDDIVPILMKNSSVTNAYRTLCTKDTIDSIEKSLSGSFKEKQVKELSITRSVLNNNLPENCVILKYFILEQDIHGVLSTLEECIEVTKADIFTSIYSSLKKSLGIEDITSVSNISEEELSSRCNDYAVYKAFEENGELIMNLVYAGLICDVEHNVDLQQVKAYDMLCAYGPKLFNLSESAVENFQAVSDFKEAFFSYVGSFLVSYTPVTGDAACDIDGGFDRAMAYVRNRSDFMAAKELSILEKYTIKDFRTVINGMDEFLEDNDE